MLRNPSQHPATPDIQHELDAETYATTLTALGWQFEALGMEEVIGQLDEELPPMEAARLIAGEMYANAVQREIATPCETAEGTRLLREYRIATRHRADAAAKMLEAASLYAYEAFGNARAERDYQDQTLSILRGKLRDLGIDGGAL